MNRLLHLKLMLFLIVCAPCVAQTNKSKLGTPPPPAPAAEYNASAWQEFSSAAGRFKVLFPGVPTEKVQKFEAQGANFELHLHQLKTLAEYSVMYADYPVAAGDAATAKQVLDNGARGAAASVNAEILSIEEITIDAHPGRLLKERMRNGSYMRAKMVLVGQRLYQVAITTPNDEDQAPDGGEFYRMIAAKFLDSFRLHKAGGQATNVTGQTADTKDAVVLGRRDVNDENGKTTLGDGIIAPERICVGKRIAFPQPAYPKLARAVRASGTVIVNVVIDEQGKIAKAEAVSGHPLLRGSAVAAALNARFEPTLLDDKPVKVSGMLTYNFKLE